jgi:hypothetical protein
MVHKVKPWYGPNCYGTIPEQNEPGPSPMGFSPPTNLTGQGLGVGRDPAAQKIFSWPKPGPKYCFMLFYTMKCAGGLPEPGPGPKNRPDLPGGTVMGGTCSARNNRAFFGPAGPHNAQVYMEPMNSTTKSTNDEL